MLRRLLSGSAIGLLVAGVVLAQKATDPKAPDNWDDIWKYAVWLAVLALSVLLTDLRARRRDSDAKEDLRDHLKTMGQELDEEKSDNDRLHAEVRRLRKRYTRCREAYGLLRGHIQATSGEVPEWAQLDAETDESEIADLDPEELEKIRGR